MSEVSIIVNKYLGIPYLHRGRDKKGLDCYGLILAIYRDFGIKLMDIDEEYTEGWAWKGKNYFLENYHLQWEKVESPRLLDVILFHNGKDVCNHAGVFLRGDSFIHTCKQGTVIGSVEEWSHKLYGVYRHKT